MIHESEQYLAAVLKIARQAGAEITALYKSNNFNIKLKPDDSPLTDADLISNDLIRRELQKLTPDIPVLSEEGEEISFSERSKWHRYWLVDPLDGTNEFIYHTGMFSVNIALIENHVPVLGVCHAPHPQKSYYACRGMGAFRELVDGVTNQLHTRKVDESNMLVVVSKTLGRIGMEDFLLKLPKHKLIYYGGSLKLCMVAEGLVDIYPRFGHNCEWDTAAGQCIVEEAGGAVVDMNLEPLRYNTKDSLYNPHFVVLGDPDFNWAQYF